MVIIFIDAVEIAQATDEDVERLAVQIGNDADPYGLRQYRTMHCVISCDCALSENTHRILQRTFAHVKVQS